jgi:hypothetical protein
VIYNPAQSRRAAFVPQPQVFAVPARKTKNKPAAHGPGGNGGSFVYQRIANDLRRSIREGVYRVGDQLPRELDLARKFNVALLTLRRAHQELESEGIIRRECGRGTFVTSVPGANAAAGGKRIGWFILDMPLEHSRLRGIRRSLEAAGGQIVLDMMDQPSLATRLPDLVQREKLDLVVIEDHVEPAWARSITELPCPVVVWGTVPASTGLVSLTPDWETWSFELTQLLRTQLGFDYVWLVLEPLRLYFHRLVLAGYRRALRQTQTPQELVVLCDDVAWEPFIRQFGWLQPKLPGKHAVIWMYRYPFVPVTELPAKAVASLGVVNLGSRHPGWFLPAQADLGCCDVGEDVYSDAMRQYLPELMDKGPAAGAPPSIKPEFTVIRNGAQPTVQTRWRINGG